MCGPARGRRKCVWILRASWLCLAVIGLQAGPARPQSLTSDLLRPLPGGFVSPQDLPLRKTAVSGDIPDAGGGDPVADTPAPSRVGQIPQYGLPAASGASDSGFDSLNRARKRPKYYPGQAKPKPPPGPGSAAPDDSKLPLRLSIPPSESANKQPLPPAMAGTVTGEPARRGLKVADDPFGAVGDYAGGFLVKSAVELSGGYDTNPGRTLVPKGVPVWGVGPGFLAV